MPDDVFRWVIAAAVALACVALLVQAGVAVAICRISRKMQNKFAPLAERTDAILQDTRKLLEENGPRVAEVSRQAVELARTAQAQAAQVSALLEDAGARARIRIAQIDSTVDATVTQVEQAGDAIKGAVLKPVREANALMAGLRAAVATYVQGAGRPSVDHATQDEEMFI